MLPFGVGPKPLDDLHAFLNPSDQGVHIVGGSLSSVEDVPPQVDAPVFGVFGHPAACQTFINSTFEVMAFISRLHAGKQGKGCDPRFGGRRRPAKAPRG